VSTLKEEVDFPVFSAEQRCPKARHKSVVSFFVFAVLLQVTDITAVSLVTTRLSAIHQYAPAPAAAAAAAAGAITDLILALLKPLITVATGDSSVVSPASYCTISPVSAPHRRPLHFSPVRDSFNSTPTPT